MINLELAPGQLAVISASLLQNQGLELSGYIKFMEETGMLIYNSMGCNEIDQLEKTLYETDKIIQSLL